jgi:hypothetical protein
MPFLLHVVDYSWNLVQQMVEGLLLTHCCIQRLQVQSHAPVRHYILHYPVIGHPYLLVPLLHGIRRVSDLPSLPPQVLKTLEWQLRKDIGEVERVARQQQDQQIWMANNRVMENVMPDWSMGLNLQPLYTTMGQQ